MKKKYKRAATQNDQRYLDQFMNDYQKELDKLTYKDITSNKYYKKSEHLVKKYSDLKAYDLVKTNQQAVNELKNVLDN